MRKHRAGGDAVSALRITAERIAELKRHYPRGAYSQNREHHPFGHIAYSTIDIHELIDALESAYAELDRLRAEFAEIRQASEWLDSLKEEPEDRRDEEIFLAAQRSFRRWKTSVHGCMSTKADSIEYHIIWATLDWARRNMVPELEKQIDGLRAELETAREEEEQARRELEDERDRVNVQREDIRTLRLQLAARPVAVEVPEPWNEDSCRKILSLINQRDEAVRLAESLRIDAAANLLRDVPPSRILKDGAVAIRADVLSAMEGCIATLRADDELIPSKALAHLDALRSNGGE